ncbi:tetratricopeptide repeat protein [Thermodesulfobacteriota bacterium]
MKNTGTYRMAGGSGSHLIILLILVVLAYSNTFNASWHLDDITNILDNTNVHVSNMSIEDWSRSIRPPFTDPTNPESGRYRPVAMLTFAFNWYLEGSDVFGYHLVNIGIHCVNSCLLFLVSLSLLHTPNMIGRYQGSEYFIAIVATALWALHPIQTQAVTYIVQRMASLATLFYLGGILFFLKARRTQTGVKKGYFFGFCLLSFMLAVGSKQNAATLPVACLLIEVIFITNPEIWKQDKAKWMRAGTLAGLAVLFGLLLLFWQTNSISTIMDGYRIRPFTMGERLLTEFRVLVFYLYQIFYPVPGQFSILHDLTLSKSLFDPWTTSAAVVMIGVLFITAFYTVRRQTLVCFAILFYFLGHSIESTIFPLELVFEHRNYLPSLFLFLPVASGLKLLIDKYQGKNRILYFILLSFVFMLTACLGIGSYTRNSVWATEKSLWQDAMEKAPSLARPYQNVALVLERENRLDSALNLYRKALDLKDPDPMLSRFISLGNMGNIYKKRKDYEKAVHYLTEAARVEKGPYAHRVQYNLVLCLMNSHKEEEALERLESLLAWQKDNSRFLTTKGFLLIRQGKMDLALHHLRIALKQNPYDKDTLISLAMALSAKGFHERAEWFLQTARIRNPENLVIYLALLQNAIEMQDINRINNYMFQTTELFRMNEIKLFFIEHAKGYNYINEALVPVEDQIILPYLVDFIKERALKLGASVTK